MAFLIVIETLVVPLAPPHRRLLEGHPTRWRGSLSRSVHGAVLAALLHRASDRHRRPPPRPRQADLDLRSHWPLRAAVGVPHTRSRLDPLEGLR